MNIFQSSILIKLFASSFFLLMLSSCDQANTLKPGTGRAQVEDVDLFYSIMGEGEPVLVIHGGPGLDHTYLMPQFGELSKNIQLIFYDQRGSGQSTGRSDSNSITIDQFVKDLEGLRQHLNLEQLNILGHSWGGLLAMHYAVQNPERIKSLILVSSHGATDESLIATAANLGERMRPEIIQAQQELMGTKPFLERESTAVQEFMRLQFEAYFYDRSLLDSLYLKFSQQTASNGLEIYGLMLKQLNGYDLRQNLWKISVPVLVIHGANDPIPLSYAKGLAGLLPDGDLEILDKCGHFPFIEAPDLFVARIQQFLADHD